MGGSILADRQRWKVSTFVLWCSRLKIRVLARVSGFIIWCSRLRIRVLARVSGLTMTGYGFARESLLPFKGIAGCGFARGNLLPFKGMRIRFDEI